MGFSVKKALLEDRRNIYDAKLYKNLSEKDKKSLDNYIQAVALLDEKAHKLKVHSKLLVDEFWELKHSMINRNMTPKERGRLGLRLRTRFDATTGINTFSIDWFLLTWYKDGINRPKTVGGRGRSCRMALSTLKNRYRQIQSYEIDLFNRFENQFEIIRKELSMISKSRSSLVTTIRFLINQSMVESSRELQNTGKINEKNNRKSA